MRKHNETLSLLNMIAVLLLAGSTIGCTTKQINYINKHKYAGSGNAVTELSQDGHYRFTLYSADPQIPLRKIHHWILRVETRDGIPVENAKVFVFGGMPAHRHGFPTKPRVKEYLGNGKYKVEGIKFSMPGAWEMRFNIKHKKKNDRVVFKIDLK